MSDGNDEKLREFLKRHIERGDVEPKRDLWPAMLRRFEQPAPGTALWFDWALAGAALLWLVLFPKTISVLLYHL